MAQDFLQWLQSCYFQLAAHQETRITVVGVLGKETSGNLKATNINQLLLRQNAAFGCGSWSWELGSPISVDAFFSADSSVLYLLVNGIYDTQTLSYLFASQRFRDKSYLEKMAIVEMESIHLLHLVFILSHLVIFIEQSCRFDTEWLRTLKALKSLRIKAESTVKRTLAENCPGCPKTWLEEGRLAVPKLLFAFHRSPLRADLGIAKRKELLEKLEKSLEGQLVSLLQHHKIVEKHSTELALARLPPIPNEFAYIFRQKEILTSADETAKDLVNELFGKSSLPEGRNEIQDVDQLLAELEAGCERSKEGTGRDSNRSNEYDFNTFVGNAISDLKNSSSSSRYKEYVYEFPKLKNFVNAAKVLYNKLITERDFDFTHVVQKINAEVLVQENTTDKNMQKAVAAYEHQLRTGTSIAAFSLQEHEEKLQKAIKYLSDREVKGERLNCLIKNLTKQCTEIWQEGHQRCESISLTGHQCQCALSTHDDNCSPKSLHKHSTGFQLLSTCNCGRSQAVRPDPFTYQQANFDFYVHTGFECCARAEKIDIPVFQPNILEGTEDSNESEDYVTENDGEQAKVDDSQRRTSEFNLQYVRILTRKTTSTPRTQEESDLMLNKFNSHSYDNDQAVYKLAESGSENSSQNDITSASNQKETREERDYETTSPFKSTSDEEESEEEEKMRRQKLSQPKSSSDYESEEDENNEENVPTQHSLSTSGSAKKVPLQNRRQLDRKTEFSASKKTAHYLDDYDVHLKANRVADSPVPTTSAGSAFLKQHEDTSNELMKAEKHDFALIKIAEKYKGKYLSGMPFCYCDDSHSQPAETLPPLLPLFPSWSLICLGQSSLYNHSSGIRNQPNFKAGSEYLLPWDVRFTVNTEQWQKDMDIIAQQSGMTRTTNMASSQRRHKKNIEESRNPIQETSREKVKLFVGFDYECPRGHRFMVQAANKPLRHRRINGAVAVDAAEIISSSQPLWMPCTCRREPRQLAQLMRIHVVTPKAPVSVILHPKIKLDSQREGYFHMGLEDGASLGIAKYYVLRLPFSYKKPIPQSEDQENNYSDLSAYLMPNCITIAHSPLT